MESKAVIHIYCNDGWYHIEMCSNMKVTRWGALICACDLIMDRKKKIKKKHWRRNFSEFLFAHRPKCGSERNLWNRWTYTFKKKVILLCSVCNPCYRIGAKIHIWNVEHKWRTEMWSKWNKKNYHRWMKSRRGEWGASKWNQQYARINQ